jgi:hypothetical protein
MEEENAEEENVEASTFFQIYEDDGGVDDYDINTYRTHDDHSFEKRRKTSTGYFKIVPKKPYSCVLQLSTGYVLRFKKQDGWNLLLPQWFESNDFVRKIVSRSLRSVAARLCYLSHIMEEEEGYDDDGNMTYYDLKEQVMESYLVETRLRNAMRNVLMRWRNYHIDKRHQDIIDPITLSEPEKQIVLYDWSMKRKFIFDAKSLSIHIETALLYHEEGFAIPCYPRNPWTNLDFTYRQLVSIYEQLKIHGELRWGFMTLRQHNFNKSMWHKYHHTSITLKAVQTSLVQLDSANARDLLEDFIIMKINEVEDVTPFLVNLYRTAIVHVPRHWIIEQWKKAAFHHYESQHFGLNRIGIINRMRDVLLKKQSQLIHELTEEGLIP